VTPSQKPAESQAGPTLGKSLALHTIDASTSTISAPLLDREAEAAQLDAALNRLGKERAGSIVVIEGPAGIGKTRLLEHAIARARAASMTVLQARASELETEVPFGVARQFFEPLLVSEKHEALLSGAAELAGPIFPTLGGAPMVADPSFSILHGLHWLAVNVGAARPLVLALDDAHWADGPSLRYLIYLANRIVDLPIVVVATTRRYEPGAEFELLDQLAAHPNGVLVRPAPLGRDAVARLVESYLDESAGVAVLDSCLRATGGNALFLHELLRELAHSGGRGEHDLQALLERPPESLARAIGRRLAHLPQSALAVARAAAVFGASADPTALAVLADLDSGSASAGADLLTRAEILTNENTFHHPLVRSVVYAQIPTKERSALHRRAAALLTGFRSDPDQEALHLAAATPANDARTVEVLREAARRATKRGAPGIAANYLRRALEEPPADTLRVELLTELGLAETAAHGSTGFAHLREALAAASTPRQRAEVVLEMSKPLLVYGRFGDAAEVLQGALDELTDAEGDLRPKIEGRLITAALGDLSTLDRLGGFADLAERITSDEHVRDPLWRVALGVISVAAIPPASRGADMAAAALRSGDLSLTEDAMVFAGGLVALTAADRLEEAREVADRTIAEARRDGSANSVAFASALRARVLMRIGDVRAAESDARDNLRLLGELLVQGGEFLASVAWPLAPLLEAMVERGELQQGEQILSEASLGQELPELAQFAFLQESIGLLRLAQGRRAEGIAALRDGVRRAEAWGALNPGFGTWRIHLGPALAASGEPEEGLALVERELAAARQFELPREGGMALRAKALIVGGDEGVVLLHAAVETLASSEAQLEHARALADLGAALRRAGQRVDARDPLRRALDAATKLGASALAARAHAELVQTGARPRKLALSGPGSLTASELRVARMAADGLTNREIAQALFLAEKTVEGHLSNAYRKLDISARTQLPAALEADDRDDGAFED